MSPPYARASRRLLRRRSPRLYMPGLARRLGTLLAPGRNSATSVPDTLLHPSIVSTGMASMGPNWGHSCVVQSRATSTRILQGFARMRLLPASQMH